MTAYSRAPASGLWRDGGKEGGIPVQDDIVVYEVMAATLDRAWWGRYRRELEDLFLQEELVVRAHVIERL